MTNEIIKKRFCFNKKHFPKLRNKNIKKMFKNEEFMEEYGIKANMYGRGLIFDVPNSGINHVIVREKNVFDEKGNVVGNCNGYWYSLKASELMWCGTTEEEHDKHCMILEGFVSGHNFSRFK